MKINSKRIIKEVLGIMEPRAIKVSFWFESSEYPEWFVHFSPALRSREFRERIEVWATDNGAEIKRIEDTGVTFEKETDARLFYLAFA